MDIIPAEQNDIPERARALVSSPAITAKTWDLVRSALRPDLATPYFDRAKTALNAGLTDAAINYVWNVLEEDLRKRIMSYGIDYFASAISKSNLRSVDDLSENVKSIELLDGCFSLGIISDDALFHLQHCRELRNKFSAAHFRENPPDQLETANFIKNCVKYALCHELPAAGFSIKDFVASLDDKDANIHEAEEFLQSQSSRIHGPLLNHFFEKWMDSSASVDLLKSIKAIAPRLWTLCNDGVRSSLAMRYVSLRERPKPNDADRAREFITLVGGISYIPPGMLAAIFKKMSQNLIDAYQGSDNYYNEPSHARALAEIGSDVPPQAASLYAKAILLSYVGNSFGHAWNAESYTKSMLLSANQYTMAALYNALISDSTLLVVLQGQLPARRFTEIAPSLAAKTPNPEEKILFEKCGVGSMSVRKVMLSNYKALAQQLR